MLQVLSAIKHSDIVLSGGGTLLQNGTSTRSLMYYLTIIKIAKFFRKESYALRQRYWTSKW